MSKMTEFWVTEGEYHQQRSQKQRNNQELYSKSFLCNFQERWDRKCNVGLKGSPTRSQPEIDKLVQQTNRNALTCVWYESKGHWGRRRHQPPPAHPPLPLSPAYFLLERPSKSALTEKMSGMRTNSKHVLFGLHVFSSDPFIEDIIDLKMCGINRDLKNTPIALQLWWLVFYLLFIKMLFCSCWNTPQRPIVWTLNSDTEGNEVSSEDCTEPSLELLFSGHVVMRRVILTIKVIDSIKISLRDINRRQTVDTHHILKVQLRVCL